jgi:hypothetical protein
MPSHTLSLSFLTVFAVLALFVGSAGAFCLEPHPKVSAEFFKSDAVFVGTVLTERTVPEKDGADDGDDGWVYRLRIKQTFRGSVRDAVEVFTENNSGRFQLVVGETYLLFAYKEQGHLTIYNCGNSGSLSQTEDLIPQIKKIKKTTGGEVEGLITIQSSVLPLAEISIVVRGEHKTYRGVTGRDGWFHIHVPAGTYTVRPESSSWDIVPFDLSYDKPDHVVIHDGGSAGLKFLASPK